MRGTCQGDPDGPLGPPISKVGRAIARDRSDDRLWTRTRAQASRPATQGWCRRARVLDGSDRICLELCARTPHRGPTCAPTADPVLGCVGWVRPGPSHEGYGYTWGPGLSETHLAGTSGSCCTCRRWVHLCGGRDPSARRGVDPSRPTDVAVRRRDRRPPGSAHAPGPRPGATAAWVLHHSRASHEGAPCLSPDQILTAHPARRGLESRPAPVARSR